MNNAASSRPAREQPASCASQFSTKATVILPPLNCSGDGVRWALLHSTSDSDLTKGHSSHLELPFKGNAY